MFERFLGLTAPAEERISNLTDHSCKAFPPAGPNVSAGQGAGDEYTRARSTSQVFHQITSGLLQVNGVMHQCNTRCTCAPPYNRDVSQSPAVPTYLACLVNVAEAAQCSLTPH